MSDLSTQLRDYFDAVIERTTAEDVLARSAFHREPGAEAPSRWTGRRPALQAALAVGTGFGLTMLVAGGLLFIALLAGELTSDDAVRDVGSGVATPAGGAVGLGWIVAVVLMITGAATAGGLAARSRRAHPPLVEESDMTTIETDTGTKEHSNRIRSLERRNRWLVTGVVVLLVALAALGGILLFGGDDAGAAITPAVDEATVDAATIDEINTLIDANLQGWSEGDGDAVMATMAADGFHISAGSNGFAYSGDRLRGLSESFGWVEWDRPSTPIIEKDGNGFYVAELDRIFPDGSDPAEGDSILIVTLVVSEDGELRIAEQVVYEDIDWWRYGPSS